MALKWATDNHRISEERFCGNNSGRSHNGYLYIVHLVRDITKFVPCKDLKTVCADLKKVYRASVERGEYHAEPRDFRQDAEFQISHDPVVRYVLHGDMKKRLHPTMKPFCKCGRLDLNQHSLSTTSTSS